MVRCACLQLLAYLSSGINAECSSFFSFFPPESLDL
uniref:Uncharacterized protein n=1 Tax=Anguilla anguilla TaxID=7936 RepID=A0A0E9VN06_ANGAN